jgi:predicted dehydrogenase
VQNAELVAVAARDVERAKAFAIEHNIEFAFSYEELYTSNQVDAIYVATTHNFHYEQCVSCMQNGKAILCEKPITVNDSEFKNLAKLSAEKNVFLMEAMWTYFLPPIQKAKAWIEEGRIGSIKVLQADFGFLMEYNPSGRLYNPSLAGGALLDLGVYVVAFATFFMDRKPDYIQASGIIGKTNIDESTGMIFKYDEVSAVLFTSILTVMRNTGYIFGTKGYIEIPELYRARKVNLFNAKHEMIESFVDSRTTMGYNFEIQEATDCILAGKIESEIVPHSRSNELQEIMTEVRRQIGLKYPMENN